VAAPPLQLEIQGDQSHFRFDVPGPLEPRLEPVWKEAANPPQVVEIREVWEIPGARLVSSDGSPAAFWREWAAFLARLRIRGPSFANLQVLSEVVPGHMVADVMAILGSIDFVMGECDR